MFEFLKRKKRRRDFRMECVYAGPEEMARRNGQSFNKADQTEKPAEIRPDDAVMETVYAGPEDVEIEDVYGGPGMFGELDYDPPVEEAEESAVPDEEPDQKQPDPVMEGVYAGPQLPNGAPMMTVYAGPKLPNDSLMMAVYAGPQMKPSIEAIPPAKPDPSQMMFVYAGPDYFNNRNGQGLQAARKPEDSEENLLSYPQNYAVRDEEESGDPFAGPFCPNCGRKVTADMKTCECGWTLIEEDQTEEENPQDRAPKGPKDVLSVDPPMAPVYTGPEYWNNRPV